MATSKPTKVSTTAAAKAVPLAKAKPQGASSTAAIQPPAAVVVKKKRATARPVEQTQAPTRVPAKRSKTRVALAPKEAPVSPPTAGTKATAKTVKKTKSQAASPAVKKVKTPKLLSPQGLVKGKHIVCFWKQNDLGLFGRRPDRWLALWEQDASIEKVLVFETPLSRAALDDWMQRALTLDAPSASEYRLLLDQALAKQQGQCDTGKTSYRSYLAPSDKPANNQDYLRWVLQQVKEHGIENPTVMVWPACFANAALVQAMKPCQTITDLVDDQRLFAANALLVPTITAQYQMWLGLSDTVVSNSLGLIAALGQEFRRSDIDYLPNQSLETAPVAVKVRRSALSRKKRLVVGYVGNLRDRIDTEALLNAMAENPDKDFWFIGQTHGSAFYAKARTQPNSKFWGTMRHSEAQHLVAQFDMAITPFVQEPSVAGMGPSASAHAAVPTVALSALKTL